MTGTEVGIAIWVAVVVSTVAGFVLGRFQGKKAERLRTELIFDVSMRAISSPTVFSVFECVVGRITTDKLRDEQKAYMRLKEQEKKDHDET